MAKQMYKTEEITLQDGTEIVLKPAVVARLRRIMKEWDNFGKVETDDDGFDVFINCSGIALEETFKGKFDSLKATKEEKEADEKQVLSTEYKEYLENTLELDSIYKILDVVGGIKLNDPKLLEAVASAQAQED